MARKPLRRSDLLSRLRTARRARSNPVDKLLLVNPARRRPKRKWGSTKQRSALRKMIAANRARRRGRPNPTWSIGKSSVTLKKRIHVKRGRPKSNPKRKRHMAKRKWGSKKQRSALRKMLAANRAARRARPNPGHKSKRGGRRKRRMTAKALAAARRNLRKARSVLRGSHKRRRSGRRRYRKNPLTKGQKAAVGRMSKGLRRRLRKAHRALRRRRKGRKGGTVARKKKRGTRKKGYRFTAARRRAAMRNIKKARRMRTRGRKGGSKRRRGGRKSKALRRYRSRGMRVIRSRTRRGRRRGLTTLHRARRFLRGRRKVGRLAKAFARRWRMRSNPGVGGLTRWGITLISSGAWALGGLMGTGLIGGIVRATPLQGILGIAGERHVAWITSLVAALGLLWLTSRVGFLRRRQTPIMIGAGLGVVQNVLAAFAPGVLSMGSGGGMSGTYVEDSSPLADYIVDGTSMGDYVPELGADVEQALAGYVVEGPIGQAVAGLSGPSETALARSRGAAWTATGPIPPRPGAYMGAGYMGIFDRNIFNS